MSVKVRLSRGQLNYFRAMTRKAAPKEIQAFLEGEVISPELTVIDRFHYPVKYADHTPTQVAWYMEEYQEVVKRAEERGKRIVGFIHSHPEWDAVLSPDDYNLCITDMHHICGICSTTGVKTRVRFWVMNSALPCEIEYGSHKRI